MGNAALFSILLSILLNLVESTFSTAGALNDTFYLPEILAKIISAMQVFLPLLAIIFSLINCFTNKITTKLQKFLLILISAALFFANLNWLISWFIPLNY